MSGYGPARLSGAVQGKSKAQAREGGARGCCRLKVGRKAGEAGPTGEKEAGAAIWPVIVGAAGGANPPMA